jgi:pyruvate/2-oxoglutarate dehydrogenase complex dihydrolipoamide acyltransferase (E2) component
MRHATFTVLGFVFAAAGALAADQPATTPAAQPAAAPAAPAATAPTALSSAPAPAGAEVYFISPKDGETVTSPVLVRFGLKGMGVAPAGIQMPNTGHHHLLVDATDTPAQNQPLGKDANHVHFGGGQTEASVELKPGKHTLQLVVGDYLHVPFNPSVASQKITVTVK